MKKLLFLFVLLTYLHVFLLKFRLGEIAGCEIKFHIQRVPTRTKKVVFSFLTNMSIQPLWFTHFIEILLALEFQLTKFIVGAFSYKAQFIP